MNKAEAWDGQTDQGKKRIVGNYLSLIKTKSSFTANLLMSLAFTCCSVAFDSSVAI